MQALNNKFVYPFCCSAIFSLNEKQINLACKEHEPRPLKAHRIHKYDVILTSYWGVRLSVSGLFVWTERHALAV